MAEKPKPDPDYLFWVGFVSGVFVGLVYAEACYHFVRHWR